MGPGKEHRKLGDEMDWLRVPCNAKQCLRRQEVKGLQGIKAG